MAIALGLAKRGSCSCCLMPDIAGIDPSQAILRARAGAQQLMTPEALQAIRADLQLDRSAMERLWDWLALAVQGDLGVSW